MNVPDAAPPDTTVAVELTPVPVPVKVPPVTVIAE